MNDFQDNCNLLLRSFQDSADFALVANIRNQAALKHYGNETDSIDAQLVEKLVSTPDKFQIAEFNGNPGGFIFVVKEHKFGYHFPTYSFSALLGFESINSITLSSVSRKRKDITI